MEPFHWQDIDGNDGNVYRIKLFEEDNKITSTINLVTLINGMEDEVSVQIDSFQKNIPLIEILEKLKLAALSASFSSH